MKLLQWVMGALLILAVPVFLFASNIRYVANEVRLYSYGFDKYQVSLDTGIERDELVRAARELIRYFNSGKGLVDIKVKKQGETIPLFTEREAIHLRDVRDLFQGCFRVQEIAAGYIVLFAILGYFWWRRKWLRNLARWLFWGSVLTVALIAILGIGALFDFEALFWQFHVVSFANDFWQLDPAQHYLIRMFPEGFWRDVTLIVAVATLLEAIFISGLAYLVFRRKEQKDLTPERSVAGGAASG